MYSEQKYMYVHQCPLGSTNLQKKRELLPLTCKQYDIIIATKDKLCFIIQKKLQLANLTIVIYFIAKKIIFILTNKFFSFQYVELCLGVVESTGEVHVYSSRCTPCTAQKYVLHAPVQIQSSKISLYLFQLVIVICNQP